MTARKKRKKKSAAVLKQERHDNYVENRTGSFVNRVRNCIYQSTARAKKAKIKFTLKLEDFQPRDTCPCCGEHFGYNNPRNNKATSPSIDRLDPKKGYTKDNCWVICHRCNLIKNDATVSELEAIARAVRLEIVTRHAKRT